MSGPVSDNVVSFAEAFQRLSPFDGVITQVTGPGDALAEDPGQGLPFRDGDIVQIVYRAQSGKPEIRSVLYGPTAAEVGKSICRTLGLQPQDLIAVEAGDPRPFDLAWICRTVGADPGERLARVRGISATWINFGLGHRPYVRVDLRRHSAAPATPMAATFEDNPFLSLGDDE